jgi:hypothetical protein
VVAGGTRGLRREKEGFEKADKELEQNLPVHAAMLGVDPGTYGRVATLTQQIGDVRKVRVIVGKLLEVLDETEVYLEDEREGVLGNIVNAVRNAAKRKDPSVTAAFEETIRYHGQVATRAAKTRRKNAEAAEETEPPPPMEQPAPAPA